MALTQARLKELLHYDPITGSFTWIVNRGRLTCKGKQAGYMHHSGYLCLTIEDADYRAHRVAWLYVHGEWPASILDHKDRNRANNAFDNLRLCGSHSENSENRGLRKDSSTGYPGVTCRKGRCQYNPYEARLQKDGKRLHLGNFGTPEEAYEAYLFAKKHLHQFQPTSVV